MPAGPPAPKPPGVAEADLRSPDDAAGLRRQVYDQTLDAIRSTPPASDGRYELRLSGADYADPEDYTPARQKQAVLSGETLGRRVRGTWELYDTQDKKVVDRRTQVVARVPYLTDRGVFLHRGAHYGISHQARLLPGVFTRLRANGEPEAHVNALPGQGRTHHYELDPASGQFRLRVEQASVPLGPLLRAMGVRYEEMAAAWGKEAAAANQDPTKDAAALRRLKEKFLRKPDAGDDELVKAVQSTRLDPAVTGRTLGSPYESLSKEAILAATSKLLRLYKGEAEEDDRDDPGFQRVVSPADMFVERVKNDFGRARLGALRRAVREGSLSRLPSGLLTPQLEHVLLHSGVGQALDETNTIEILDKLTKLTKYGEGGLPSTDATPDSSRNVRPSQLGFVDTVRTPENLRVGVDGNLAVGGRIGPDGQVYAKYKDRSGATAWKSPRDLAGATVALPGYERWPFARIPVMRGGKVDYAKPGEVDLFPDHMEQTFSAVANLIPFKANAAAQRTSMASRMITQALPLLNGEAPYVRNAVPGSGEKTGYDEQYGHHAGAVFAPQDGRVVGYKDGKLEVAYADGSKGAFDLYENYPLNRRTFFHQEPVLGVGQSFRGGQTLVRSNYTDREGNLAVGLNARVAYVPFEGRDFEDAAVVSEGFARRATSGHAYRHDLDVDDKTFTDKKRWVGLFAAKFPKETLEKMDDKGVVKPGTVLRYGDPVILAAREKDKAGGRIFKRASPGYADASVLWEHEDPGVVTDVAWGKNGPAVSIRADIPMRVGDKIAGRYGDKSIVAAVVPDERMPQDAQGRPFEVLLGPEAITTRGNPAQKAELALGKLAALTGKPYRVEDFRHDDVAGMAAKLLALKGMTLEETVTDPQTGLKIKAVPAGSRWLMRLHHLAESKEQARSGGSYSADDTPSKGGYSGAKRIGMLNTNAIIAHGATAVAGEAGNIRGTRAPDYWLKVLLGHTPPEPDEPPVYRKFLANLKAAGVNVVRDGPRLHVMGLTSQDVKAMTGDRAVTKGATVRAGGLDPVPGGLFDKSLTGGHAGGQWSYVPLDDPVPNPVMEDPLRHLLGLTKKQYEGVIAGTHDLPKHGSGVSALKKALEEVDVDREIASARASLGARTAAERDAARRRLGYLAGFKKNGLHPKDFLFDRAPVLPPAFRPVSQLPGGTPVVADPNYLYQDLIRANENLREVKKQLGAGHSGPERLAVYHAFKAVTGLGDPVGKKSVDKQVTGILKHVFGSSPKYGSMQRQLLSTPVDNVGRGTVVPDPDLDMDQIGIPEDIAYEIYARRVAGRLVRSGLKPPEAVRALRDRSPAAKRALLQEMEARPVYMDRAPVWHKYGVMGFRPVLTPGRVVRTSPLIVKGFGMDYDGDAVQIHLPETEAAVKQVLGMMPSKHLISPGDFKTPMFAPGQQYQAGLYHASTAKSKRPAQRFASVEDALRALGRGEILAEDPIEVFEEEKR